MFLSTSTTKIQKRKNLILECFDLNVGGGYQPSDSYQEIDDYLGFNYKKHYNDNESDDVHILMFWRQHQHSFPILAQ
ncbi:unnamed protein product [Adineta steineri]|uniref:Uncharacterized protein n=1 Tax=Adineta steineri TaxID=433720 RepID=A0A815U9B3_9BILA|nr:unnamed protein product [Adineta steineri]CAF4206067.1 unnamed protein product [Adineta steineri]